MADISSINGNKILVDTTNIAQNAVNNARLADGAVGETKIANGAVTTNKIGSLAVTDSKIAASAVTGSKIAEGAVSTSKMADGSVTLAKLGSDVEIEPPDGSIIDSKLAQTGGVLDSVRALFLALRNGGEVNQPVSQSYQMGYVHGYNYDSPHQSTNTVYSQLTQRDGDTLHVNMVSGYQALVVYYTNDGTYTGSSAWVTGNNTFDISLYEAFAVEVRRTDSGAITTNEANGKASVYYNYKYTDNTLSVAGKAADASAAGVALGVVSNEITSLVDALSSGSDMQQPIILGYRMGYVHNGSYSNPSTSASTVYSLLFEKEHNTLHIDVSDGFKALPVYYDASGTTPDIGSWLTGENTLDISSKTAFCIEVRKSDNSSITVVEATSATDVYYTFPVLRSARKVVELSADSVNMMTVTENCDIFGNGHAISVGEDANFALFVNAPVVVNVYDLKLVGGIYSAARVTGGATVNFYNCEFAESGMGMSTTVQANTNCWDCIAHDNRTDGFNYHGIGRNTVYNCCGIDNGDDGISNHEQSTLKIVGGKWIGNAKAGIAAPTYGAVDTEILDVYCADNVRYGMLIYMDEATDETVVVQNAIIVNSPVGVRVSYYQCVFNNVKFDGCTTNKEILGTGSITEY